MPDLRYCAFPRCGRVEFSQGVSFDGRLRFTIKDHVEVEINDGERLSPINIANWSLNKLKESIRILEKKDPNPDTLKIPRFDFGLVVEKQELIDALRMLMRRNPSVFLEDEGENHPLKRFGRRMTHAYHQKLRHWPLFRRFEEMCKLKALSSILDARRGQIAMDAQDAEARAARHVDAIGEKKWRAWEVLSSSG